MTSKWWESLSVVNSAIRKDKTTDAWASDLFTLTSNGQLLGSIQQHLCESWCLHSVHAADNRLE